MTTVSIERSAITTGLLVALRTLNFPVGDNNSPTDAAGAPVPFGWQGEPDAAGTNFIPWLSLTPMPGNTMGKDLDTLGSAAFWQLNYSLYIAGVNRNQSEILADRARNLLCNLGGDSALTVEGQVARWALAGVECTSIGSNARNGTAIPYYYTQTDTFRVLATEET